MLVGLGLLALLSTPKNHNGKDHNTMMGARSRVAAELSKSFGQWREVAAFAGTVKRVMGGALHRMMKDGMNRARNKWHASALESKECARKVQRALM